MKSICFFIFLFIFSCTTITTRENDEKDISQASKTVERFYSFVKVKDFKQASEMSGGVLSIEDQFRTLNKIDSAWGNLNQYELAAAKTSVKEVDGKVTGQYNLKYSVKYD